MDAYSKSKTPIGAGDKRQTPRAVFNRIQQLVGMPFDFDVCAEDHTAKVDQYWTEADDSLSKNWFWDIGAAIGSMPVIWMNPPYSDPYPWCEKAANEAKQGCIVVGLLPDDRSVGWYQDWVEDKADRIYVPDKRISFEDGEGVAQNGNPKGSVVPVWTPFTVTKSIYERFNLVERKIELDRAIDHTEK